jgi:hypothetical protein
MSRIESCAVVVGLLATLAACGPSSRDPGSDDDDTPPPADAGPIVERPDAAIVGGDVNVLVTADNAYSFGYGDVNGIVHFTQGRRAQTAGEIFNCPIDEGPDAYLVPAADAPPSAYLYIVTWDDLGVTQGVLGQFKRQSGTLYTGDPSFEVCATGLDYSGQSPIPDGEGDEDNGPTQAVINREITACNAGSGSVSTTSKGWVNAAGAVTSGALGNVAIGEDNSDPTLAGDFPQVCPVDEPPVEAMDPGATWMWYLPPGYPDDPFQSIGSNVFRAFLIFRVEARNIPID